MVEPRYSRDFVLHTDYTDVPVCFEIILKYFLVWQVADLMPRNYLKCLYFLGMLLVVGVPSLEILATLHGF